MIAKKFDNNHQLGIYQFLWRECATFVQCHIGPKSLLCLFSEIILNAKTWTFKYRLFPVQHNQWGNNNYRKKTTQGEEAEKKYWSVCTFLSLGQDLPLSGTVGKTCSESSLIPTSLPLAYNYIKVIPRLQPNVSRHEETVSLPTIILFSLCRNKQTFFPVWKNVGVI